ncbi:MAG: 2-C-methyl-D-erythritol 4-phosphate cytidylyltransferase [Alistipes sp.]|nr:2-C-methyl-D-erythritol 4-phosphate cytidylyltransferase [Alistipes sp.]
MSEKHVAVVLAGGKGSRMGMDIPKQYIEVNGKMLICYTLDCFQRSFIDEIVVVAGQGEEEFFQKNIVDKYEYTKVTRIVPGGRERFHSVFNGLCAIEQADYVYIHDGARCCIDEAILLRGRDFVKKYETAVAAMPVKDTIKIVSDGGVVTETLDRSVLWQIQTPQIFRFADIKHAYAQMMKEGKTENITDDAMVMERYGKRNIHVFEGSYNNIKVTTCEDLEFIKNILKFR